MNKINFPYNYYDIIDEKIYEYVKGLGNKSIRIKGLYQNIVWETLKYIHHHRNMNNNTINNRNNHGRKTCPICKEEKKEDEPLVSIGCPNHHRCCATCFILYVLDHFHKFIKTKGQLFINDDYLDEMELSFEHLLDDSDTLRCFICRGTLQKEKDCECQHHRRKRCSEDIRKNQIDHICNALEMWNRLSQIHGLCVHEISSLFLEECRKLNNLEKIISTIHYNIIYYIYISNKAKNIKF